MLAKRLSTAQRGTRFAGMTLARGGQRRKVWRRRVRTTQSQGNQGRKSLESAVWSLRAYSIYISLVRLICL